MKRHNLILTALFTACLMNNVQARAQDTTPATTAVADEGQENAKLDEIHAMLRQLADAKAIEIDEGGNIRVKQSVVETLRSQGRLNSAVAGAGHICD